MLIAELSTMKDANTKSRLSNSYSYRTRLLYAIYRVTVADILKILPPFGPGSSLHVMIWCPGVRSFHISRECSKVEAK